MIVALIGLAAVLLVLWDSFEVMVLPRRITRRWRLTRWYYRYMWKVWRAACQLLPAGRYRQNAMSIFGPLSLLGLFACWLSVLISGFALMYWGLGTLPGDSASDLRQYLYHSGETFFTLGYGDLTPATYPGKFLAVVEAGTGFGFMAIIIGYLPVLYQAFSRREQTITLLDARAGSPPTASELFRRSGRADCQEIQRFLVEWEAWAAELLESHLSFPVLSYYRSQHDNQSWLAALALILDSSSVLMVVGGESCRRRAELTFAMARHASVDLCLVFWLPPTAPPSERLASKEVGALISELPTPSGLNKEQADRLRGIRDLYEPFLQALSDYFVLHLPRFLPEKSGTDNWQTSAWTKRAPGITDLPSLTSSASDHFGN